MQDWIIVDEDYLNFLRSYESRIPFSDYGADKFKPFFGVLFEIDDLVYVTQISHVQPRHYKMRNSLDFYKIFLYDKSTKISNRLAAVVNLNYMFPVPKTMVQILKYGDINNHRAFSSPQERSKYINLLKMEMNEINKMNLGVKAQKLYRLKINHPEHNVSKRCIDFKFLESKVCEYKQKCKV